MNKYFKDHYDIVIIGGALAGLASALTLLDNGYDVLVLEQHNLPGGVATSFVRGGVELEASLHEMLSIGSKQHPLKIRKFLESHNINVDWLRVSIAFRYVTNKNNILVHAGENGDLTIPCKDIADACGDKDGSVFKKTKDFLEFCLKIHDIADEISDKKVSKMTMLRKYKDFVKILGYSFKEVMDTYKLPKLAEELLSAYWLYLGTPIDDCPFLVYAYMVSDYLAYGSYIPRNTSHELSLKMAEEVMNRGAQVEFGLKVEKILVKNKKVYGVKLANGMIINCDYAISGAYPNTVYEKMIEPRNEIPKEAIKTVNAMDLGVSCFSLVMLLDRPYQELGIKDYATFNAPHGLNINKLFESGKSLNKWDFVACTCGNIVCEDATPPGTCVYTITYLPNGESFKDMNLDQYEEYKRKNAEHFLEMESNRLGVNLKEHILELVIETPLTIAHYTGAYMGTIYGYRHAMNNHSAARQEMEDGERFISGLAFSGAHQTVGDGMSPAISNGIRGANAIIAEDLRRKGESK